MPDKRKCGVDALWTAKLHWLSISTEGVADHD